MIMNNIYKTFSILVLFCFIFSCSETQKSKLLMERESAILDSLSNEIIDEKLVALLPETNERLTIFEEFQNLNSFMLVVKNANAYNIRKYADSIDIMVQEVDEILSEEFEEKAIHSRLSLLTTTSSMMNQIALHDNPSQKEILKANLNFVKAYNSFLIQLNELSLVIPEELEMKLMQYEIDSIVE